MFSAFGFQELITLVLALAIFFMLIVAGRAVGGRDTYTPLTAVIGFTVIYQSYVIGSFFYPTLPISVPLVLLILLVILGFLRTSIQQILSDFLLASISLLLISPLLVFAATSTEPLWDDYTHWLVSAKYLISHSHLPTAETPAMNHAVPNYPWSRALLHSWVNGFTGTFTVNVQPIFNMLFASTLLLWPTVWGSFLPNQNSSLKVTCMSMGILTLLIIIFALCLKPEILSSSYADPIFSICITHLVLALCQNWNEQGSFSRAVLKPDFAMYLLFIAPLTVKPSGLYFSIIAMLSFWSFMVVYENIISKHKSILYLAGHIVRQSLYLLPVIIMHVIWSLYLSAQNVQSGLGGIKPTDQWNFHVLPEILFSSFRETLERPFGLLGFLICLVLVIRSFTASTLKQSHLPPYLILTICFFIGTATFQILAYCLVFGEFEAKRAASFNRYMGPASLALWGALLFSFWQWWNSKQFKPKFLISCMSAICFFSALLFSSEKFSQRNDRTKGLQDIASQINQNIEQGSRLLIVDALGNGFHSVVIRFYLGSKASVAYLSTHHIKTEITPKLVNEWAANFDYIYIHTIPEYVSRFLNLDTRLLKINR